MDKDDDDPTLPVPEAEVLAVLAESEADIAAGRVVSLETVLAELDGSIVRVKAEISRQRLVSATTGE